MNSRQLDEERIFRVARDLSNPATRAEYLDQICAGDHALRARAEALLQAHEQSQGFPKSASPEPAPTADQPPVSEDPGHEIGRYKLLQKIGEGGFGVVYMAEQQRPVRRKVAIKIIKPGMDTHAVVARFEAERQALALMDHPNIARVFDGGTTETGRPYFVMELIRGVPVTEYCDTHQLSIRERMALFVNVCQAVHHAHQKGIIHRDLKPSNVLVTQADGKPVVKVIDFGVAKALNQLLTEKTLFTAFGQMVGTPQYMSPEQAELTCLDVDTRSDVYSLGVLCYEILTGSTPLDGRHLQSVGYAEMQRLIRDQEPPTPSTRLSTASEQLTAIATHRNATPNLLRRTVRGDLDWIVMKALDKDRNRRYDTVASLAADIQAYLNNKPVVARRPSAAYRARKFLRRNRVAVAVTGVIATCLLLIGLQFVTAYTRQHRLLRELQDEAFTNALGAAMSAQSNADTLIQRAADVGVSDDRIFMLRGQRRLYGGDPGGAVEDLQQALQLRESLMARGMLVVAYHFSGDMDHWLAGAMRIRDLDRTSEEPSAEDLLFWAQATCVLVDPNEVLKHLKESMAERTYPLSLIVRAETLIWRAIHEGRMADAQDALEYIAAAEKIMPNNPYLLHMTVLANYIADIIDPNRKPLAERIIFAHRLADQIVRDFPEYPHARVFAASYLDFLGETDEAVGQFTRIQDRNPYYASCAGMAFYRCGRWDEAHDEIAQMPSSPSKAMVASALLDTAEGRRQCAELFDELAGAYDRGEYPGETNAVSIASIMFLLGDPQKAESRAKGWLPRHNSPVPSGAVSNWGDFGVSQLKFVAGEIDEKDLLAAAAWSKLTQSAAHWLIGARHLAYGRRSEAKTSFEKASAYPAYWFTTCPMGMGLSRRMEDPTWPDWIVSRD